MEVRVNSTMSEAIVDSERQRVVLTDTEFSADLGDGLTITGRLAVDAPTATIGLGEIRIDAGAPLTPAQLKSVRWGQLLDRVIDAATMGAEVHEGGFTRLPLSDSPAGADIRKRRAGPRRRLDDDHYREVARLYRRALDRGQPVRSAIAREMTASESTVGTWIGDARVRGFLGPAPAPGAKGEQR